MTTITGSITGSETLELDVDPSSTVLDVKLRAQDLSTIDKDQRLNPKMDTIKGVVPDFQRLFSGDVELRDDSTLKECRVKESSDLRFAVGKKMGIQLRAMMRRLREPEDLSNTSDCTVLSMVLGELKNRMQDPNQHEGQLLDKLYDLFDIDFGAIPNVKDGALTLEKGWSVGGEESDYIFWEFFALNEDPPPFKTCFGIPVFTTLYTMKPQYLAGGPNPGSLVVHSGRGVIETGAQGYFGGAGNRKMGCTAHFAKEPGTRIFRNST